MLASSGTRNTYRHSNLSIAAALLFAAGTMIAAYRNIGMAPVVIVGGSSIVGMIFWIRTYLSKPVDPRVILPPFLLTVAGLEIHMAEEYLTHFGPAMSRVFDVSWTEQSFLMVFAFIGPALYTLTALGLYYRVPLAGFLAWFIFIGPGVAELTHFIFPLLRTSQCVRGAAARSARAARARAAIAVRREALAPTRQTPRASFQARRLRACLRLRLRRFRARRALDRQAPPARAEAICAAPPRPLNDA